MDKIEDGGPAYPARVSVNRNTGALQPHQFGNDDFCTEGMSLRDAIAIGALQGMLAWPGEEGNGGWYHQATEEVARQAYEYADAMVAARAK